MKTKAFSVNGDGQITLHKHFTIPAYFPASLIAFIDCNPTVILALADYSDFHLASVADAFRFCRPQLPKLRSKLIREGNKELKILRKEAQQKEHKNA